MPACHAGGRGFESLPDRHFEVMIADIALQIILAAIVGGIWLTPLVVNPAAKASLDDEALKYFLKSFFFRFHLFIVSMLLGYLCVVYFFKLEEYDLLWSNSHNLVMLILFGTNILNLLLSLIINNTKIDTDSIFFKCMHGISVAIFASTSLISLYFLIEKFVEA